MSDNKYRVTKWAQTSEKLKEGTELKTGVAYIASEISDDDYIEYSQPVKSERINAWLLLLSNMARMLVKFGIHLSDKQNLNFYRKHETLYMEEGTPDLVDRDKVIDSVEPDYRASLVMRGPINPRKTYKDDGTDYDTQGFYDEATETKTGYINGSLCLRHFPLITRATSQKAGYFVDHEYNFNATTDINGVYTSLRNTTPNQKTTPLGKLWYAHHTIVDDSSYNGMEIY